MPLELLLVSIAITLVQVAGYALLGQGVLALLVGPRRRQNLFYRVLETVASPAVKAMRWISPRFILDQHLPVLTFFVLVWVGLLLVRARRHLCGLHGLAC
jgi:hypothetical protein